MKGLRLTPPDEVLDPRIHPWRKDLAAAHLKGKIDAPKFTEGLKARIKAPIADLRKEPSDGAGLETQLCFGEIFEIYDEQNGWAWGQAASDGYVGYLKSDKCEKKLFATTHIVSSRQTIILEAPSPKAQNIMTLGMGAEITVEEEVKHQTSFAKIKSGGFIPLQHLQKIDDPVSDFVSIAESLIGVPYLWGGRDTRSFIDCSALVQLAFTLSGISVPRNSDMQEKQLGQKVKPPLRRGDLVFWKAHVGIMLDEDILLHANAFHMSVAQERLSQAQARIQNVAGAITSIKRPD